MPENQITTSRKLRQAKCDKLIASAQQIVDRAETEGRSCTPTEDAEFKRILGEVDAIQKQTRENDEMRDEIEGRTMHGPTDPNFDASFEFDASGAKPYQRGGPTQPKLSAFKGPQGARDAFDFGLWVRAFVLKDGPSLQKLESRRPAWMASQTEVSPTAGGYSVPPEIYNRLVQYREQVGVSRKLGQVLPMSSDTLSVPKMTSGQTVYYPGESEAITPSDAALARVNLSPRKRAILSYISTELSDDNAVGLMDVLMQRMAHQLALQEDSEFINGDGGSSTYGGVLGCKTIFSTATAGVVQAATNNDTWPELTYADIAKAMSAVASKYRTGGELAFLCSTSFKWQVLDRLSLAQGGALMQTMTDGVRTDLFAGYPVFTSDYMPTTTAANTICLLFGNFKQCSFIGDRQGIRLALSEHVAFTSDQIAMRATVRYDINHHEFGNASTAGGVIALKTAA